MSLDYNINKIMNDYNTKKKYEEKAEIKKFEKENCTNCKNKKTVKCHITRDLNGKLKCAFIEK